MGFLSDVADDREELDLCCDFEQSVLKSSSNFKDLKKNLAVFEDEKGFLRCQGRIENSPFIFIFIYFHRVNTFSNYGIYCFTMCPALKP